MSLHEVSEAAEIIQEAADPNANIIFGTVIDRSLQNQIKVTVIATGFDQPAIPDEMQVAVAQTPRNTHTGTGVGVIEPAVEQTQGRNTFFRNDSPELPDLDPSEDGHTPNFANMKDDLDVPSFLRKQMD